MIELSPNSLDFSKDIQNLGSSSLSASNFGIKASSLSLYIKRRDWVPAGFVVSKYLVDRIAHGKADAAEIAELKSRFDGLSSNRPNKVVVRSSSILEGLNGNSFAGLNKSIRGVKNLEELLAAIKECYHSSDSKSIRSYSRLKDIAIPPEHLALIIQQEVDVKYSCLAGITYHCDTIELYNNDIIDSTSGNCNPSLIITTERGVSRRDEVPGNNFPTDVIANMLELIQDFKNTIHETDRIHLEIGSNGKQCFIFQANVMLDADAKKFVSSNESIGGSIEKPLKAAAMDEFYRLGLFPNQLKIFSHSTVAEICDSIRKEFSVESGITVRYSYKNEISLPRGFFNNIDDIYQWLLDTYKNDDWHVIVHPFLEVRRSFELLLDNDEYLLEHIPGMWESDNTCNPDVLYSDQDELRGWIWKKRRQSLKGLTPRISTILSAPVNQHMLESWHAKLKKIIPKLVERFAEKLPLNFHFVEDEEGKWHFLNIRSGFSVFGADLKLHKAYKIRNRHDAEKWDGKSPIRLQISSKRGKEDEIIDILSVLPKGNANTIIVDFGLLSHPAMILREFGYKLVPSYFYNVNKGQREDYNSVQFDRGSDPITRIMNELPVYENEKLKVVHDRNPLNSGHYLIVAKQSVSSFAELEEATLLLQDVKNFMQENGIVADPVILERGRAKFCTSGFTNSHAHAHLLSANDFNPNLKFLFARHTHSSSHINAFDAYKRAELSNDEYLMFIGTNFEVELCLLDSTMSLEKQFIRNFLKRNSFVN